MEVLGNQQKIYGTSGLGKARTVVLCWDEWPAGTQEGTPTGRWDLGGDTLWALGLGRGYPPSTGTREGTVSGHWGLEGDTVIDGLAGLVKCKTKDKLRLRRLSTEVSRAEELTKGLINWSLSDKSKGG